MGGFPGGTSIGFVNNYAKTLQTLNKPTNASTFISMVAENVRLDLDAIIETHFQSTGERHLQSVAVELNVYSSELRTTFVKVYAEQGECAWISHDPDWIPGDSWVLQVAKAVRLIGSKTRMLSTS